MSKKVPKFRKTLNQKQIDTLKLLYKFRFATTYLIAKSQGKTDETGIYSRLRILNEQEYIGRNYDSSYRLRGQHASYYLQSKGLQALKSQQGLNHKVLHSMYKDKTASQQFITHGLNIFAVYAKTRELFPGTFSFFTKSELADYDYFPKLLPDSYLARDNDTDFFLDIFEETMPFFVIKRKITSYLEHYDSGDWDETNSDYPAVLLVCGNATLEKRLQKHAVKALDSAGIADLGFYTTTLKALLESNSADEEIWSNVFEPLAVCALTSLKSN